MRTVGVAGAPKPRIADACARAGATHAPGMPGASAAPVTILLEREVVIVSNDGDVRREVSDVVARHPGARTVFGNPDGPATPAARRDAQIVVIDDATNADALEMLHRLKRGPREASVVYLASYHSTALEGAVRRAGASFYCIKSARDGKLARVIEALLGQRE
jgi:DNA-binding NarL/FixJ family response regulator